MGWTVDPVPQAVLFHYSEDPSIRYFDPHVPKTNPGVEPAVWAVDALRAPLYWLPRHCPRVSVWANDVSHQDRLERMFRTTASRVQAVPLEWSEAIESCTLYEYQFAADGFVPNPDAEGQWVAHQRMQPTSTARVGDLLERHREAGVDLRLLRDLRSLHDAVVESGLPFSIVRWPIR